jgi:hypothetical protein
MLRAPWEMLDGSFAAAPPAAATAVEQQSEVPRSPGKRRELFYQQRKADLSRAWLAPRREPSPWEATTTPMQPQYWPPTGTAILDPVANVVLPAAINPSKGSGTTLTPEEVAAFRAAERLAFARRLAERWKWNVSHL